MIVEKKDLLEALKMVGRAIKNKTTLPVLTHVKLETIDGKLWVSGTDMEQFISHVVSFRDDSELNVCVSFILFRDIVTALPGNKVGLEQDATRLYISSENTQTDLAIIPGDEFVLYPQIEGKEIVVDCQQFKTLIGRTIHAVGTDQGRVVLTGMLIKTTPEGLIAVSADGFQMAVTTTILQEEYEEFSCIVPGEILQGWISVLDKREQDVTLSFSDVRITLHMLPTDGPEVYYHSQLIEGSFVNYTQILPRTYERRIVVDNAELQEKLKLVNVIARESAHKVILTAQGAQVTLKAAAGLGETAADIQAIEFEGEFETCLNGLMLMDALNTCGETVVIQDSGQYRPVEVFTESEKEAHVCIIMPMHLRDN